MTIQSVVNSLVAGFGTVLKIFIPIGLIVWFIWYVIKSYNESNG